LTERGIAELWEETQQPEEVAANEKAGKALQKYSEGTLVHAKWNGDGQWYAAVVLTVNDDGGCVVRFDEDGIEQRTDAANVALQEDDAAPEADDSASAAHASQDGASISSEPIDHACDLQRFSVHDPAAAFAARAAPVILTGWDTPVHWDHAAFMQRHGQLPQVPPVSTKLEADTGLTTTLLKDSVANVTTAEYFTAAKAVGAHPLMFTYDSVNPVFFDALRSEWKMPSIIAKDLTLREQGYVQQEQFTAAEEMAQHYVHNHREAWLGLVQGRKWWYFLTPDVYEDMSDGRVLRDISRNGNGTCSYLRDGPPPLPPNAHEARWLKCLQRSGEVLWFPDSWWHATCSLDHWTVGIGSQIEDPMGRAGPPPPVYFNKDKTSM
jgi:hypothetical protein